MLSPSEKCGRDKFNKMFYVEVESNTLHNKLQDVHANLLFSILIFKSANYNRHFRKYIPNLILDVASLLESMKTNFSLGSCISS